SMSWPCESELGAMRRKVVEMCGRDWDEVRIAVSPYRICPIGAHIDHQGGTVSAMTINKGILLGFVPSHDSQVVLESGQFEGQVKFRVDEELVPGSSSFGWGSYAKGAIYALHTRGNTLLKKGIVGFICGGEGLDSSGLSSSASVGVAYLLAFESANGVVASPADNIEYDRVIENEYLGLNNGILDQSAILLSTHGCLTSINCKTKQHKLVRLSQQQQQQQTKFKILLAFSGLKQALVTNPGYNARVAECRQAAKILFQASGKEKTPLEDPLLSDVEPEIYEEHKHKLQPNLAKRAEHYFSENKRVLKGLEAWAAGNLSDFGRLITASGSSSIRNYQSGCEPLIQLYEILLKAPGVYGARFSGAGFRGCCIAFVEPEHAVNAAAFVEEQYTKLQPNLAKQMHKEKMVLICDPGDCARLI
ncbi:hypothetical protein M569_13799, partial [Genlisea aurea]